MCYILKCVIEKKKQMLFEIQQTVMHWIKNKIMKIYWKKNINIKLFSEKGA